MQFQFIQIILSLLFQSEFNDHDSDNVPSHLEDLDGDYDLTDDNSDEDQFANLLIVMMTVMEP